MPGTIDISAEVLSSIFVLAGTVFTGILVYLGARSKNQGDAISSTSRAVIDLTTKVAELLARQAELERKITVLEDENNDLKALLAKRNAEVAALNLKVDELEQSKYAMAQTLSEVQAELDTKNLMIADLQAQIDRLRHPGT